MHTLTTRVFCTVLAGFFCAAVHAGQKDRSSWTTPLENLGINGTVDRLAEPPAWTVHQVSSYDRTGGNADDAFGHQVYEGGVVLADLEGPGMVSRIWLKSIKGAIHFYIDDMESPLMSFMLPDLFEGRIEYQSPTYSLFSEPFVGQGSGGYYCYVPIPYKERCRIIVAGNPDPLAYQVTHLQFAEGTPIESFQLKMERTDINFFKNWKKSWDGANYRWHNRKTEEIHHSRHKYWPESNKQVYPIKGPGAITELEMNVQGADADILANVWISVFFDDQEEPGVLAPIGEFFGSAVRDSADADGLVLGRDGGRMWCRYPMPFHERAEVRFINLSDQIADIEYWVTWREEEVGDQRYFFARYNQDVSVNDKPYTVANVNGTGHFVGATVAAAGANSLTFLEGDDVYKIDSDDGADFHGTGTDDYFNSGWYFASGPSAGAAHGAVAKQSKSPAGFSAFRSHIVEPVPFHNAFVFELEHGESNNAPGVTYSSVAYWYQDAADVEPWLAPDHAYKDHFGRRAD